MGNPYEPIDDWSPSGRASLVAQRGTEIRLLLDAAFTTFCDEHDLAAFGFRGDDLVAEAVEWCVNAFVQRDLDPAKLRAGSRSFRLFTEVRFWLAQKVGARALGQLLQVRQEAAGLTGAAVEEPPSPAEPPLGLRLGWLRERLARTLRELGRRTCADLVGYWLRGTQGLRARLFHWSEQGHVQEWAASKTRISAHVHDARFRFQCLHNGLVDETASEPALRVVREMLLSPCDNEVPYRRAAREVMRALPPGTARGPREVRHLCLEGSALLLRALAARLVLLPEDEGARAEWLFGRQAMAPMTLSALGLEDREDLRLLLEALPPHEALLQDAT
jgi:hypothetical protein